MNESAIAVLTWPLRVDCEAAVWARLVGAALLSLAVMALEAWLRVPVQPVLDGYLQATLSRASAIAATLFPRPSF